MIKSARRQARRVSPCSPTSTRSAACPPYVFEEVNKLKARLRAQGVDIIDFGMGNPDMPTPKPTSWRSW